MKSGKELFQAEFKQLIHRLQHVHCTTITKEDDGSADAEIGFYWHYVFYGADVNVHRLVFGQILVGGCAFGDLSFHYNEYKIVTENRYFYAKLYGRRIN